LIPSLHDVQQHPWRSLLLHLSRLPGEVLRERMAAEFHEPKYLIWNARAGAEKRLMLPLTYRWRFWDVLERSIALAVVGLPQQPFDLTPAKTCKRCDRYCRARRLWHDAENVIPVVPIKMHRRGCVPCLDGRKPDVFYEIGKCNSALGLRRHKLLRQSLRRWPSLLGGP